MSFRMAHAGVDPEGTGDGAVPQWRGWLDLATRCLDRLALADAPPGGLGLLYVTEPLAAELPAILDHLVARSGVAHWAGAVAPAICATGNEYFGGPAMAMMVCALPDDAFRMVRGAAAGDAALAAWTASRRPALGIVHGDPRNDALLAMVPQLAAASGAFLVGGLTSAAPGCRIADTVTDAGLSGVLFAGDVAVTTGLTQGCTPIGPQRTVTALDGDAVAELDGRPAFEAFRDDIGDVLARDLRRVAGYIHGAVPVPGSDTGDYLVRNLAALDPAHGRVTIAADLTEGDRLMFVRRDPASAVEDMQRMLAALQRRVGGGAIRGGIYHSCVARGPHQFGPGARELTAIRETLGDFPLVGFFGNGEISHDRVYTYTGILTLFLQ